MNESYAAFDTWIHVVELFVVIGIACVIGFTKRAVRLQNQAVKGKSE